MSKETFDIAVPVLANLVPLDVREREGERGVEVYLACGVFIIADSIFATIAANDRGLAERRAKAKYIARAVNSHDSLYAALKATGIETEEPCSYDHHGNCQAHGLQPKGECYVEIGLAALKLAEDA